MSEVIGCGRVMVVVLAMTMTLSPLDRKTMRMRMMVGDVGRCDKKV